MSFRVTKLPGFDFAVKIECFADNDRVGYVCLLKDRHIDVPGHYAVIAPGLIKIASSLIEPDYLGQGYGLLLLREAIKLASAHNCSFIAIDVESGSTELFKKLGFLAYRPKGIECAYILRLSADSPRLLNAY